MPGRHVEHHTHTYQIGYGRGAILLLSPNRDNSTGLSSGHCAGVFRMDKSEPLPPSYTASISSPPPPPPPPTHYAPYPSQQQQQPLQRQPYVEQAMYHGGSVQAAPGGFVVRPGACSASDTGSAAGRRCQRCGQPGWAQGAQSWTCDHCNHFNQTGTEGVICRIS